MDMATMALPIRELSADVQYEAAYAQKTFWKVVETKPKTSLNPLVWVQSLLLSKAVSNILGLDRTLIGLLKDEKVGNFDAETFDKIASDLERIVSMTYSFIDDAHKLRPDCVNKLRSRLEELSDLTAHLDNFAESFRAASDEACTALLADIAAKVTADVLTPAL
jgi:hypothetical protein